MRSEILTQLDKNPDLYLFLREYPLWHKILNRDPSKYSDFIDDYKLKRRKIVVDRIDDLSMMITLAKELM